MGVLSFEDALAAAGAVHKYNPNHLPAGTSEGGEFASGPGGGGAAAAAASDAVHSITSAGGEPISVAADPDQRVINVGGDEWNKQTAVRMEREYKVVKPKLQALVTKMTSEPDRSKDPKSWGDIAPADQVKVAQGYANYHWDDANQYPAKLQEWRNGPGKMIAIDKVLNSPERMANWTADARSTFEDRQQKELAGKLSDAVVVSPATGAVYIKPDYLSQLSTEGQKVDLQMIAQKKFDFAVMEAAQSTNPPPEIMANVKANLVAEFERSPENAKFSIAQRDHRDLFPGASSQKLDMPEHFVPIGTVGGGEIASWDDLPSDAQTETESKYVADKYDNELEYQQNEWLINQAPEDAAEQMANSDAAGDEERKWLRTAVEEHFADREENGDPEIPYTVEQLDNAIILNEKGDIEWNKAMLNEPKGFDPDPNFEGIDPPKPEDRLTPKMREDIESAIAPAYVDERDKRVADMEMPDYLGEQAKESASEQWDKLSDEEKFNAAKDYELVPDNDGSSSDDDGEGSDYEATKAIAHELSTRRTEELLKERNIEVDGRVPSLKEVRAADEAVWSSWKSSSTSTDGQALQIAAAEEMGGRLHTGRLQDVTEIKEAADGRFADIGGYAGLKAYVRAKWETTQYLLDKADQPTVNVYRGIMLPGKDIAAQERVKESGFTKLPNLNIVRNGASSTTASPGVANNWNGIGQQAYDNKRVVLRATVPRTAVLSVPVYGDNVQGEKELVVMGTAWHKWDAWLDRAPDFDTAPIAKANGGVWRTADGKLNVDILEYEITNNLPHWLSKPQTEKRAMPMDFKTALRKYDPSEPRDDSGKWTDGGSVPGVSRLEQASLAAYQGAGYGGINRRLLGRSTEPAMSTTTADQHIANLDNVMSRTGLKSDAKLYRSFTDYKEQFRDNSMEGKVLTMPHFLSTSKSLQVALARSEDTSETGNMDNFTMHITAPAGTRAIDMDAATGNDSYGESELLLDRDSHLRIDRVDPSAREVHATLLQPDKRPGGVAFASPSVADHKDFDTSIHDLASQRQHLFERAGNDVDRELGMSAHQNPVVGAWSDGAENSTMTQIRDADPEALRVSAAMKGWLGQQKAVLVFSKAKDGPAAIYDMEVPDAPDVAHKALLGAGVAFHTLVPTSKGTRVLVVDTDGSVGKAVGDFAVAHNTQAVRTNGHAEFIGDQDGTGSDAEQRQRARDAYEKVIAASDAPRYRGRTAGDVFGGIRDRWRAQLEAQKRLLTFGAALAKFSPDEARDDEGKWTADGHWTGSGDGDNGQTKSTSFRQWFGDSKVVDNKGRPLRMYHGTASDFAGFDPEKSKGLIFLSSWPETANDYAEAATAYHTMRGQNVIPAYVSIKNPVTIENGYSTGNPVLNGKFMFPLSDHVAELMAAGHDGIIMKEKSGEKIVVAFDGAQVKSAIGNRGTFDPRETDMTKALTFNESMASIAKLALDGSLYVHRPLENAERLHSWAKGAGIPNLVPPHEMHVTQVYSRNHVVLEPCTDRVTAVGDHRGIARLGDKGAAVLHFQSPELQARHKEAMAAGASHDWPSYLTHVTLSYGTGDADLSKIEPPSFPLVFGPEVHAGINENWAEEKGLRKALAKALFGAIAKYDPSEPRDNDGKWTEGGGGGGTHASAPGNTHWSGPGTSDYGHWTGTQGGAAAFGDGNGLGPTMREADQDDAAWERMAHASLAQGGNGARGIGHLDAKAVKSIWIKNSPLKTLDDVYAGAPANKAELDTAGEEIAKATGTEYRAPGIKKMPRVLEKHDHVVGFTELMKMAARGNNPAAVTDIVRATFACKTPAQADAVSKALAAKFPTTDEGYKVTDMGYFDRAVNVKFKNGQIGEVLIAPPELIDAKSEKGGGGHGLYTKARAMQPGPERDALVSQQHKIYGDAREKLPPEWKAALSGAHGA